MKAKYFKSVDDVLIYSPITRFLSKIFGKSPFVYKCKSCKKIPTEIINGKYCSDCYWNYEE